MAHPKSIFVRFAFAIAIAAFALIMIPVSEAQQYTAEDLGTLPGDSYSQATAINLLGQVVGISENDQGQIRGFLWTRKSGMQDLGMLPNSVAVYAEAINIHTQVVGWTLDDIGFGHTHAFLWSPGDGMQDLGMLPSPSNPPCFGCFNSSAAFGINDWGQVVGESYDDDNGCPSQAFLWTKAKGMQDLTPNLNTPLGDCLYGFAINNFGQVVGGSPYYGAAFLWSKSGGLKALSNLNSNPEDLSIKAAGLAINDFGQIVGYDIIGGSGFATLWTTPTNPQSLGSGAASGINDFGQIVGGQFVWTKANGMQNLNSLIKPPLQDSVTFEAYGINQWGQIVGTLGDGTYNHAALLTPRL